VEQQAGGRSGAGILVGTPPRVVAPYATVGDASHVKVTLPGWKVVDAERWGGDPDLGIVVLKLPEDVAKDLRGVDVEGDWARVGAGCIGIGVGTDKTGRDIRFVDAARPALGTIDIDSTRFAVFGSRGTLIGIECTFARPASGYTQLAPASGFFDLAFDQVRRAGKGAPAPAAAWALDRFAMQPSRPAERHYVGGPVIRRVLDDLESNGAVQAAYLGVVVGDLAGGGVRIDAVVAGSPAAASDELVAGQRVLEVDGVPCTSADVFSRVLAQHRPGEEVELKVLGQGKSQPGVHRVRLAERAAARPHLATAMSLGFVAVDLGTELRRYLSLPEGQAGVVVQDVDASSPASAAGLRRGDLITQGGGAAIADTEELAAALAAAKGSIELSGVRVDLTPGGRVLRRFTATITVPERGG